MVAISQKQVKPIIGSYEFNQSYVYLLIAISVLGGISLGINLLLISKPRAIIYLNGFLQNGVLFSLLAGVTVGALLYKKVGSIIGKRILIQLCISLLIFSIISSDSTTFYAFLVLFRFFTGVFIGIFALQCPKYLAEISPKNIQQKIVFLYITMVILGIFLAYFADNLLGQQWQNNWITLVQLIPSLLFFVGLFFVNESPIWLIKQKRRLEAYKILVRIGGISYANVETKYLESSFKEK
jgi:MFS transporter, SP family, arabinose:H+ symporter